MFTLALAIIHAFATNGEFKPELLYFATFLIDIAILETLSRIFGSN